MAKPKRKRFIKVKLDGEHWLMAQHVGVKLVDELALLNIDFKYVTIYRVNAPREEYVEVNAAIADIIKVYMDNGGFAGMELADFIRKMRKLDE